MKVAIVGTRDCNSLNIAELKKYLPLETDMIISGGAVGIDSFAEELAKSSNFDFVKHVPDYKIFGKTAPLVRNTQIVKEADLVLAFWDFKSRGTKHVINECNRLSVPVKIIPLADIT